MEKLSLKKRIDGAGHLEFVEYLQDGISEVYRHDCDKAKIDGDDMFEGKCRMICKMAHVVFTDPAKTYYDIDVTKPVPVKEGSKKGPKYSFTYYEGIYDGYVIEFRKPILRDDPKTGKPSWDDIIGYKETRLVPHGKGTFTFFDKFPVNEKEEDFISFECETWEYGSTRQFKQIDKPKLGYKDPIYFYSKDTAATEGRKKYEIPDHLREMLEYRANYLADVKAKRDSVRKLYIKKTYSFDVQDTEEKQKVSAPDKHHKKKGANGNSRIKGEIVEETKEEHNQSIINLRKTSNQGERLSTSTSGGGSSTVSKLTHDDPSSGILRMKARIVEGYEQDSHTLEKFYFYGILQSYDDKDIDKRDTLKTIKKYLTLFDIPDGEPNTIIYEFQRQSNEFKQVGNGIRRRMKYQKYDKNGQPVAIDTIQADLVIGKKDFGNNKLEYVLSTMDKMLYPGGIGIYEGQTKRGLPCGLGSLTYFGTGEQIYGYWAKPDAPTKIEDSQRQTRQDIKYKGPFEFVLKESQEPNYYLYEILKRNPSMKRIKMGLDVYEGQTKFGVPHGLGTYEKGADLTKYFGGWKCIENSALAEVLADDEKDTWEQIPLSKLAEKMEIAEKDLGKLTESMKKEVKNHATAVHAKRVAQEMIYRSEHASYSQPLEDNEASMSPTNAAGKSKEALELADIIKEQRQEIRKGGRTLMSEMKRKTKMIGEGIDNMNAVEKEKLRNSSPASTAMKDMLAGKDEREQLIIKQMRLEGEKESEKATSELNCIEYKLRALNKKINKNRKNKQNMLAQITELYRDGWTEYRSDDGEDYFWIKGVKHGHGYTTFVNGNADKSKNVNKSVPKYYKVYSKWQHGEEIFDKDVWGYDIKPRVEIPDFQFNDTDPIQPTRNNIADHKADISHVWFLPACIFCLNPFS